MANKTSRAILAGAAEGGMRNPQIVDNGGKHLELMGLVLDGQVMRILRIPRSPGSAGGDEKLSWRQARTTVLRGIDRREFTRCWNC